ncbi:MAG: tyrosine-type recombinase/integrase [Dehalococcoidia bacterium]
MRQSVNSLPDTVGAVNADDDGIVGELPAFRRYLRSNNRAPKTVQTYEEAVRRFADFLAERGMPQDVRAIRREHIEAFIEHLLDTQKATTAANRFRSLQAFWRYATVDGEIVKESPMARMLPPKIPVQEVPVLRDDELGRLLAACDGTDFENRRDMALLRFMLDTGCRIGEVLALRWTPGDSETNDLDMDAETARVFGKGRRWRLVSFGSRTGRAIDKYLRLRKQHGDASSPSLWLGKRGALTDQGLRLIIRRRGERAGLGRIWPHMTRHAAAHNLLSAGMNEGDVSKLMGWTDPQMVKRYASSTAGERAIAAHKRLGLGDRL